MSIIVDRFKKIKSNINSLDNSKTINIVAISKTFSIEHIKPLLNIGHDHFGENKVQEAISKWREIKKSDSNLKLHMVGKLQSNKSKKAVELFDYIHSLDNKKLADSLSKAELETKRNIKYFIQVNIGNEDQKSGISLNDLNEFFSYCTSKKKLNVIGLMCIPPNDNNEEKYFEIMSEKNKLLNLKNLSMGMSSDYSKAIKYHANFLRIGSGIFGERNQ
jgi:pyridoxal phosphate enzyme (YggS family)